MPTNLTTLILPSPFKRGDFFERAETEFDKFTNKHYTSGTKVLEIELLQVRLKISLKRRLIEKRPQLGNLRLAYIKRRSCYANKKESHDNS